MKKQNTPKEEKPKCHNCNAPCTEDDICFGCNTHICADCSMRESDPPMGRHLASDHKFEE